MEIHNSYQAIETYFNGNKFRSRLEARYAVMFKEGGIVYEYEPEGFYLDYGVQYLPDFALHNVHCYGVPAGMPIYVEVKGVFKYQDIKPYDRAKIELFAKRCPIIVLGKNPKNVDEWFDSSDGTLASLRFVTGEPKPAFFTVKNGEIWFAGRDDQEYGEPLDKALAIAGMARFEW